MSSWFDQARERLEKEYKEVKGQKESAMKAAVRDTLLEFCRQDEEFAQAVAQGGSDRKSTRLNSSHTMQSRMPSSA